MQEIYQKMDDAVNILIEGNDKFVQIAKQALSSRSDVFMIAGNMGTPDRVNMEFQLEVVPDGSLALVGFFRMKELNEDMINFVCTSDLNSETGEVEIQDNLLFLLGEKTTTTMKPLETIKTLLKALTEKIFEVKSVPVIKLSGTALDELMLIQQEVLFKERDGKGLSQLEEDYRNLKG